MSPYAFYQFWLNRTDAEMPGLLRVFSLKPPEQIEALERETAERPAARAAQRALADEVTTLVHGAGETAKAIAAGRALFGQGDLRDLDEPTLAAAVAEIPSATVDPDLHTWQAQPAGTDEPTSGSAPDGHALTVCDLLAACGIVPSKSAARRVIDEGGAYLNNVKITNADVGPEVADFLHGRYLILRRGKRTVGGIIRTTG
jgi:tyrosyl-tRNA synthetase